MSGDAMDSLGYALEESNTARATWRGTAEYLIEHYPDILLAALAEAGVLQADHAARPHPATIVRRYATEWKPIERRYVTERNPVDD